MAPAVMQTILRVMGNVKKRKKLFTQLNVFYSNFFTELTIFASYHKYADWKKT